MTARETGSAFREWLVTALRWPADWESPAGTLLFYAYMLMPARLQEPIAVFRLAEPPVAIRYGVGYPYVTIVDLAMLGLGARLLWKRRGHWPAGANWSLIFYVALSVLSALIAWLAWQSGIVPDAYWDGLVAVLRIIAVYALFTALARDHRTGAELIQNSLALLFLTSLALNLAGFANPGTYSNQAGRMNASGLDFSTVSYVGCALALSAFTFSTGLRAVSVFAVGIVGLVMGGGRNAIPLFALALVVIGFQRVARRRSTVAAFSAAAVVTLPLVFATPFAIDRLPQARRVLDDSKYYGRGVDLTPLARVTFPMVGRLPVREPAVIGRINTWAAAIELLRITRGLPLGSDWLVQQRLVFVGVPSHSHNGFLQTALKFGPPAVFLWMAWIAAAWLGLRRGSPSSVLIAFFLASLLLDYWLLVIKAAFLLFALIRLNDLWLRERALVAGPDAVSADTAGTRA